MSGAVSGCNLLCCCSPRNANPALLSEWEKTWKYTFLLPQFSPQSLFGPSGSWCGKPQLEREGQPHLQHLSDEDVGKYLLQALWLHTFLPSWRQKGKEPLWVNLLSFCGTE